MERAVFGGLFAIGTALGALLVSPLHFSEDFLLPVGHNTLEAQVAPLLQEALGRDIDSEMGRNWVFDPDERTASHELKAGPDLAGTLVVGKARQGRLWWLLRADLSCENEPRCLDGAGFARRTGAARTRLWGRADWRTETKPRQRGPSFAFAFTTHGPPPTRFIHLSKKEPLQSPSETSNQQDLPKAIRKQFIHVFPIYPFAFLRQMGILRVEEKIHVPNSTN